MGGEWFGVLGDGFWAGVGGWLALGSRSGEGVVKDTSSEGAEATFFVFAVASGTRWAS